MHRHDRLKNMEENEIVKSKSIGLLSAKKKQQRSLLRIQPKQSPFKKKMNNQKKVTRKCNFTKNFFKLCKDL